MAVSSNTPIELSISLAFHFAWGALWRNFWLFAAILVTFVAAWVVLEVVVVGGQRFGQVLWVVAHVTFLIFFAGLGAGLVRVCLEFHDGGSPTLASAFAHMALGPKFLAGQLAYLLLVAAGLVLLLFPGLYVLGSFSMFGFRIVEGRGNLLASFRQSAALARDNILSLAGLTLILLLMNVLGACLLGVGLFVTVPLSVLVLAAIYRQLGVGYSA